MTAENALTQSNGQHQLRTSSSSNDLSPPSTQQLLHGVVLRPTHWQQQLQTHAAPQLVALDQSAALLTNGVVKCVVKGSFVGMVASQRHQALQARSLLKASWATPVPTDARVLENPTNESPADAPIAVSTEYDWSTVDAPAEPDWAIAWHRDDALIIWTACTRSNALREELSALLEIEPSRIHVVPHGKGRYASTDTAIEAALLAWELHRPVRVQAEYAPTPLNIQFYDNNQGAEVWSSNAVPPNRPSIPALLCGISDTANKGLSLHTDYVAAPAPRNEGPSSTVDPFQYVAASVFAHESHFDELCSEHELDPVEARLEKIQSERGKALLQRVAEQADWAPSPYDAQQPVKTGRGIAYSHVIDHDQHPPKESWSAWAVELQVDTQSGELAVSKLTVGHESTDVSPDSTTTDQASIKEQLSRWTQQLLGQTQAASADAEGNTTQAERSRELSLPEVNLVKSSTSVDRPLAWSPEVELPAAAAISNAIYNATGLRIRQAPLVIPQLSLEQGDRSPAKKKPRYKTWLGGLAAAIAGAVVVASPWRSSIPPIVNADTSIFSAGAIERGRRVALAGDCMVCHTQDGGKVNAGGRPLETPFGTVYSTNITSDPETGIGAWSYKAFERAMREGIHQNGSHLYPAFPYTSYAKMSDEDLQSLYAYLMTQPAVKQTNPQTQLAFPMNLRPLVAGWNLLFHRDRQAYTPDDSQSTLWNRGAYLVNSSGHCTACHTPRNALGAEKTGKDQFLGGAFIDNWEAPALTHLSSAPIPWSEAELFQYLRTGYSPLHGTAAGPMGPVVAGLAQLPESDVRAMAHYLASLNPDAQSSQAEHASMAAQLEARSQADSSTMLMPGEQLFNGACAACHDSRSGPVLFGARPSLALNTNLHSDHPDNTIQVLLHGISQPALPNLSTMPGFKDSMGDTQLEELVHYMRKRFAPDKPAWTNVREKIAAIRQQPGHP
ncbi:MAG TPA: molybdopterin-dependent oxidoreductase [Paenalcaligenes sp.]|nr:molybdopterin-dependent oxidoreductase [Paenalcaligenes sp.]